MALVLARIDDRFIHGQVIVGWSRRLNPDRIVLCNDRIAGDPWQRRIYASSVPPEMKVSVLDRAEAADLLANGGAGAEDVILLVGSPADMCDLQRRGLEFGEVNVGGMHYDKGKSELLDFVYVDRADLNDLRELLDAGVRLTAQTVPGGRAVRLDAASLDAMEARL